MLMMSKSMNHSGGESSLVEFLEILQTFRQIANQNLVLNINFGEIGFGERNQEISHIMPDLQKIIAWSTHDFDDIASGEATPIFDSATHQIMLIVRAWPQRHQL